MMFFTVLEIELKFLIKGTGQAEGQKTGSSSTGSSSGTSSSLVKRDLGTARGHSASCNRGQGPPPPRMLTIFFLTILKTSMKVSTTNASKYLKLNLH